MKIELRVKVLGVLAVGADGGEEGFEGGGGVAV